MNASSRFIIIEAGGKQIRCTPGKSVLIDKVNGVKDGDKIPVRVVFDTMNPVNKTIDCVVEKSLVLGEKIRIYKTRRRKGYEKTIGYHQKFTSIIVGGL